MDFHIPEIPYSPIDAHNRSAAAKGSPRYASLTSHANYNGHCLTLSWNDYRGYYVLEYFWAGRVVLCRGAFKDCLREALAYYDRGAMGSCVNIHLKEGDAEAIELCEKEGARIQKGSLWENGNIRKDPWWTWRHSVGAESAKDMANPRCPVLIFDWDLLQKAESRDEYEKMLRTQYGRCYQ